VPDEMLEALRLKMFEPSPEKKLAFAKLKFAIKLLESVIAETVLIYRIFPEKEELFPLLFPVFTITLTGLFTLIDEPPPPHPFVMLSHMVI
jgi:hypothetical protein